MDEFGFFKLPDEFCTGSSIMPQKKNPDVFELVRAKAAKVDANLYLTKSIISKLQSGYNRDLQLTKESLMDSFEITIATLKIFKLVIKKIEVNKKRCIELCTPEIFAAEHAYRMVKTGVPFRDAYRKIAENLNQIEKIDPIKSVQSSKHLGATGNLGLEKIRNQINKTNKKIYSETNKFNSAIKNLLG